MILVTGGTGFVGRAVVEQLSRDSHRVRVVSRGQAHRWADPVEVVTGELGDPPSLRRALEGVRSVVHLAATLQGDARTMMDINVRGSEAMAEEAVRAGVETFVHCSSAGVYGGRDSPEPAAESDPPNPETPYERTKREAERRVTEVFEGTSVGLVVLRPTGVFGPGRPATLHMVHRIRRRRLWLHGPTKVLLQPLYVRDLAKAVAAAVERPAARNETINLGGDRVLEYSALIALIAELADTRVTQLRVPGVVSVLSRWGTRTAARCGLESPAVLTRFSRSLVNRGVDISKARNLLTFRPTPTPEAFRATLEAMPRG